MIPYQEKRFVLGSDAVLTIVHPSPKAARRLLADLWRQIDEFDARFSRFRPDSELSKLNAYAGHTITVSPAMLRFLQISKDYAAETNGLFNPLVLPSLQQAGYVGAWCDNKTVTGDPSLDYSDRRLHKIAALHICGDRVGLPADAAIDSGGIGKGYLLDELADFIDGKCEGYWLSLGGDIICGGHDHHGKPWTLGVQAAEHPMVIAYARQTPGQRLAVATSGVTKRHGKKGQREWHHLIDPRTGFSSDSDILTASVAADTATTADIYASCAVIVGSQKAGELLESRGLDGLLQTHYTTKHSQPLVSIGHQFTTPKETLPV
ncbi:FAD:protein FMN transferase [Candidatus Saccharibacteria bacterium]|nr:FAD:protein FMN transferase [Candidatus Saccharibacteria bacterium]